MRRRSRAASMMPVSKGPSSRVKAIATRPGTRRSVPKRCSWYPVSSAMVSPRKNETIATSGTEPTPARSVWRKKLAARNGRATAPHVVHRFGKRANDEPEHAADFAQKIAQKRAQPLHDHDRIGLERVEGFAVLVFGLGHVRRESALVRCNGKRGNSARRNCGVPTPSRPPTRKARPRVAYLRRAAK